MQAIDGEIRSLDLSEKNLENLKREKGINEKNYQNYAERTEEARISDEMNRLKLSNISVIQSATVPSEPILPKKQLNILIGLMSRDHLCCQLRLPFRIYVTGFLDPGEG